MVTRRITIVLVAALASPAANLSVARLAAQAHPPMPAPSATATTGAPVSGSMPTITVMVVAGGSTVVKTDFPITRFALNNPAVADATVVDPTQLLVDGKEVETLAGHVDLRGPLARNLDWVK